MIHSRPGYAPRTSDQQIAKLNEDMIPAINRKSPEELAKDPPKLDLSHRKLKKPAPVADVPADVLKAAERAGAIKAAQAASNVDVNSGSALDVRSSAAELGELNALTIRSSAARTAYGYETQGIQYGAQQGVEEATAAAAPATGALGASSSLLSGAAGVASQYSSWQRLAGGASQATFP